MFELRDGGCSSWLSAEGDGQASFSGEGRFLRAAY